jgi:hypothetical protein
MQANADPRGAAVQERPQPRKRSRAGLTLGCLSILIILVLALGAIWTFGIRPYAHDMAMQELDTAMTRAVNQVPDASNISSIPGLPPLPPGIDVPIPPLKVSQDTFNNLVVLNLPPNSPVQNPSTQITPDHVRLSFTVYGFASAISVLPQIQDGKLVATNTTLEGPIGLVLSSDDITTLLNKHFADAQARLKRPIKSITLNNGDMSIQLG